MKGVKWRVFWPVLPFFLLFHFFLSFLSPPTSSSFSIEVMRKIFLKFLFFSRSFQWCSIFFFEFLGRRKKKIPKQIRETRKKNEFTENEGCEKKKRKNLCTQIWMEKVGILWSLSDLHVCLQNKKFCCV